MLLYTLHITLYTSIAFCASKGNPPVAYWRFDEGGGPTAYDDAGANDGTLSAGAGGTNTAVGQMWTMQGKIGGALECDGTDDRINMGDPAGGSLDMGTSDFTIEAWIKTNGAVTGYKGIAVKGSCGAVGYGLLLQTAGKPNFAIQATANTHIVANSEVDDGNWHHIACAADRDGNVYIYIDGKLDKQQDISGQSGTLDNSSNFVVGAYSSQGEYFFNGNIDDIKIYKYIRTAEQVLVDYNAGAAARLGAGTDPNEGNPPVGYWNFDENTGTTAYDRSGNGNDGTLTNGPVWVPGKYGTALQFDGNNDSVQLAFGSINQSAGTLTMWIKGNAFGGALYDTDGYWYLKTRTDGLDWYGGYSSPLQITKNWITGVWYHMAVTWGAAGRKVYIDGSEVASDNQAPAYSPSNNGEFGKNGGNFFNGFIDEVKIYNYVRTQAQIAYDYNKGAPVAHYKFNEGGGLTAYDESANNNDGTLTCAGATCSIPTWKPQGKIGRALYFSASGTDRSYVTASPINVSSTAGSKITISTWINPDASQTGAGWFVRNGTGGDENYGFSLSSQSGGLYKVMMEGYVTNFASATSTNYIVPAGQWSHVVIVYSQGQWFKIYSNGVLKETVTWSAGNTVQATSSFNIGGHAGTTGQYLNGYLDDFKVYGYERTPAQILVDYNAGAAARLGAGTDPNEGNPPVGYWPMDENTGVLSRDASGNNNNGTITGATWTQGKLGPCLSFSSSSNTNVRGTITPAIAASTDYTQAAWVYPTAAVTGAVIDDYNNAEHYISRNSDGTIRVNYYDSPGGVPTHVYAQTTQTAPLNQWTHVAGVVDSGNSIKVYINGVLVAENSSLGGVQSRILNDFVLGQWGGGSQKFEGKIDDVRTYNYALTQAQVAWLYNRGKPMAHWRMDEATSGSANGTNNIKDDSGRGYHGSGNYGANATGMSWTAGKFGGALDFDGVDDYVNIGNVIPTLTEGSLEMWFKRDTSTATYQMMFTDSGSQLEMCYNSNTLQFYVDNSVISTNSANNNGVWQHAAGTFSQSGNIKKLYLNGVEAASGAYTGDATAAVRYFGSRAGSLPFDGSIDDIKVYNYARTAEQVKQDYSNGAAARLGD